MVDFFYEQQAAQRGFFPVCGVDEAGRGPLAGPVCAAAVILPADAVIEGLNDSKKLSAKKREALYDVIVDTAVSYAVAFASVEEIEEYNILQATFLAMRRSVRGLATSPAFALIDGNRLPTDLEIPAQTLVGGDGRSASVAAASVGCSPSLGSSVSLQEAKAETIIITASSRATIPLVFLFIN